MKKFVMMTALFATLGMASTAFASYESFTLAPGFLPDPATGSGTSGGPRNASQFGSTAHGPCVGMIDNSPDHVMTLSGNFSYLRVSATSAGDVSLVIQGPDGSYRCNDDAVGLNPVVEGSWPAGRYNIFVGTVGGTNVPYSLAITEIRGSGSAGGAAQASASGGGTYGGATLNPGFMPDPHVLRGTSGGANDAGRHGSTSHGPCVGQIASAPDHIVTLGGAFSYLRFAVESSGDTTLVIEGPNGFMCNDDTVGLNPEVAGAMPAGTYRIWVGSFGGGNHAYTLNVTEFRR